MKPGGARLSVEALRIELAAGAVVVEDLELQLRPGEIVGLVGESGSGKTSSALALLGYHKPGVRIAAGRIELGGRPIGTGRQVREVRGRLISYVSQDPGPALNPSLRIGAAIEDVVRAHRPDRLGPTTATDMLGRVGLPQTDEFARRFPHQLSGGQQQRVCIAIALACDPSVLVLDEPTTGLDVLSQRQILEQLAAVRDRRQVAMVYVTHDLAVAARLADRIMVMYAGRVVEHGPTAAVLGQPRHPYTCGLLAATPDHIQPRPLQVMPGVAAGVGERPAGCAFAPRCGQRVERCVQSPPPLELVDDDRWVRCFGWRTTPAPAPVSGGPPEARASAPSAPALEVEGLRAEHRTRRSCVVAASDVSFAVERGACVALIGESGSGKSTIARVVAGLHPIAAGRVRLFGEPLPAEGERRTREQHRRVQLIFQNASEALNPRHTVAYAIGRPARVLRGLSGDACAAEVSRLLELVRLPARLASRYPAELSGGERQRVAIARALATQPELIICDEITSALDVSVQAAVLDLLTALRADLGLSLLFITHDLGVVAAVADRVVVLRDGIVCEQGATAELLRAPVHPYTRELLDAAPSIAEVTEADRDAVS